MTKLIFIDFQLGIISSTDLSKSKRQHNIFATFRKLSHTRLSEIEEDLNNISNVSECEAEQKKLHIKLLEGNIISLKCQLGLVSEEKRQLEEQRSKILALELENKRLRAHQEETPTKGIQRQLKRVTIKDKTMMDKLDNYKKKVQEMENKIRSGSLFLFKQISLD